MARCFIAISVAIVGEKAKTQWVHVCCLNLIFHKNFQDFFCPQCHQGFIEEVNNNDANLQNDRETTSDPIFSIIHRLISDLPSAPRRSRVQGSSSRARSRSRSPRMTFYTVGSNQNGAGDGSLLTRRNAFQFDLDELMNSFLSSPRQPPVSQRRLAELPRVVITEDLTTTQCSICFDEFKLTEADIRKLPCSHLFHEVCIFPWLRQSGTCPVCRACVRPRDQPREQPVGNDVETSDMGKNFIRKCEYSLTFLVF